MNPIYLLLPNCIEQLLNETKEGMFKFVVVDPDVRGKKVAQKMLRLAMVFNKE